MKKGSYFGRKKTRVPRRADRPGRGRPQAVNLTGRLRGDHAKRLGTLREGKEHADT